MRLLHAATLKFQDFEESDLPEYAILSHTWDAGEEVSLQDMSSSYLPTKKGYMKVTQTCRLALDHGLGFAWVDTCCIDKSSSAELTESINSMFRWYQKAKICIVYLDDLTPTTHIQVGLANCRWFTRGWTLQELLAPANVQFYDQAWTPRGSKHDFTADITRITGIPEIVIRESIQISEYPVAQKMAWASHRVTTRLEDTAYCLLGIFNVNIPLIYGEGHKAFRRLQEEIIRQGVDLSLFAWQPNQAPQYSICSLLASSPAEFRDCYNIQRYAGEIIGSRSGYALTNKGLQISTYLMRVPLANDGPDVDDASRYVLRLGHIRNQNDVFDIGIYLKKIGPGLLVRETSPLLARFAESDRQSHRSTRTYTFCISTTLEHKIYYLPYWHLSLPAFHMPIHKNIKIRTESEVPAGSWDHRSRICFRPPSSKTIVAYSFVAFVGRAKLDFGILFDFRDRYGSDPPRCLVIDKRAFESRMLFLIIQRNMNESMEWRNVRDELPGITKLTDNLVMDVEDKNFQVAVSIHAGKFELESQVTDCPILNINITEVSSSIVSQRIRVDETLVSPPTPITPVTPISPAAPPQGRYLLR